jgi:membrane protease YdiL (CAAX protease family)
MRPIAATFVVVAVVVTGVTSWLAFAPERSGTLAFWALAAGPSVALAAVAAVWAFREDLLREWLTPRWGDFSRGAFGAIALFAAAWAFVRVIAPVGSSREIWLVPLYGQIGDPRTLQAHAPAVAGVIVAAATAEELVWRGMIAQLLAERVGSSRAWLWSAGLYALAYVPTMAALSTGGHLDPILVLAAGAGALLWGGIARTTGRLFPAILAHALFDWAVVMMLPLWGPYASTL